MFFNFMESEQWVKLIFQNTKKMELTMTEVWILGQASIFESFWTLDQNNFREFQQSTLVPW